MIKRNEFFKGWFATYVAFTPSYMFDKFFSSTKTASHLFNTIHKMAKEGTAYTTLLDHEDVASYRDSIESTLMWLFETKPVKEEVDEAVKVLKAPFLEWVDLNKKNLAREYVNDTMQATDDIIKREAFEDYLTSACMRFYPLVPFNILDPLTNCKNRDEVNTEYSKILAHPIVSVVLLESDRLEELCKEGKIPWKDYFDWVENTATPMFQGA